MAAKSKSKKTAPAKQSKAPRTKPSRSQDGNDLSCPIVGIGGSAGGFEAAVEVLRHLPAKTGTAPPPGPHPHPPHKRRMARLLGRATPKPGVGVEGTTGSPPHKGFLQ